MSRSYCSYDEEWQRRKSMLIRSLFHDIPILSPVEEESNDSSQDYYVPTKEVFPSPPRPYSPLPPLIIERVPAINKHDEPEEYYMNLHKKIKRIYLKLFIEKRNLSSIDYDSNYSETSVNDDNFINSDGAESVENLDFRFLESISPGNGDFDSIIEDREARQSSASTKSNGYGADFESMDTAIVDVINYTTSNEDAIIISEEEESDSEYFNNEGFNLTKSIDRKTPSRERTDDKKTIEEQNSTPTTFDDQDMTDSVESNETEIEHCYGEEKSNNEKIYERELNETKHTGEADRVRNEDLEISGGKESSHSRPIEQLRIDCQESREPGYEQQSINVTRTDSDSQDSEPTPKGSEKSAPEGGNELIESNDERMEGDVESSSSTEGPDYRQITIEALVHCDGTQYADDRESRVYEDSVKSVILPTRFRRVVSRDVEDRIEVLAVLEENEDPKTATIFDTNEDETTDDNLEEETSPQPVTTEQVDEIRTSQDAINEDTEAMLISTPGTTEQEFDAPEEDVEDNRSHQTDFTEKNLDTIETYQADAINAEMQTHQSDAFEKKIEAMRKLQQAFTEKYLEKIKTHKSFSIFAAAKEIERIITPQLANIEKDFERTRITTPETIEKMRSAHSEATNAETRTLQLETYMKEDGEETDKEMDSPHPIEKMRTPRHNLSHGTIPEAHESNSGSTNEHTAFPQEATEMTSSSQDGVDNNVSEIQTSNDMNEILTSIFNDSRSKYEAPVSGKKRKLVDKSVQAVQSSRVTWEEMRSNFFVATPKIFRLCACNDHICY